MNWWWTWSQRCFPKLYACTTLGWPSLHRSIHFLKWKQKIIIIKSTLLSTDQILSQPNFSAFLSTLVCPWEFLPFMCPFFRLQDLQVKDLVLICFYFSIQKCSYLHRTISIAFQIYAQFKAAHSWTKKKRWFGDKADVFFLVGIFSSYQHMVSFAKASSNSEKGKCPWLMIGIEINMKVVKCGIA